MSRPLSTVLLAAGLATLGVLAGPLAASLADEPVRGLAPAAPTREVRLAELIDRSFPLEVRADFKFLQHLGWTIVVDEDARVITAEGGRPGWRKNLQEAKVHGDLVLRFPRNVARNQIDWFREQVPVIADSQMSRLAYQFRVQAAVDEATRKLAENCDRGRYVFPHILLFESMWFRCQPPHGWQRIPGEKTMHVATGSSSRAIRHWYEQNAVGECYVAQWIAIFATRYELYGPVWFEEVFEPDDLVLGRPQELRETTFGRYLTFDKGPPRYCSLFIRQQDLQYDTGAVLAPLGPRAFAGLGGIIQNEGGGADCNENFVIVSMTEAATRQLDEIGGFGGIQDLTNEALRYYNLQKPLLVCGRQLFEYRRKMEEVLASPVLTETLVYIHPYGVIPLRQILEQKIYRKNVGVLARIYSHGLEDAFYQQYRNAWTERWMRTALPTPSTLGQARPPRTAPTTIPTNVNTRTNPRARGARPAGPELGDPPTGPLPPLDPQPVPGARDDLPLPRVHREPQPPADAR